MVGDMSVAVSTQEPEVADTMPTDIQEKVDNLVLDSEPSGKVSVFTFYVRDFSVLQSFWLGIF